jgi:hypothetical protein
MDTDNPQGYAAMPKPPAPLRRNVIRYLASVPLLPLASIGRAYAAATFPSPGLGPDFDAAVADLKLVEDMRFGTRAVAGGSAGIALRTLDDIASRFNPLEGDFTPSGGHQGGTGPGTINSEVQRYATQFNPQNHVLEADGLRLQAVLNGGHFLSYLRGNVDRAGNGFNAGAEGASAPTLLADIGLTARALAEIEVGTCIVGGSSSGLAVVVAKDASAGTITFEAVSSGLKTAYKGNWHVTFTKFAFARVAIDVPNGTASTVKFKTPLASAVVPGMFAMGVVGAPGYFNDPQASDRARVASISADRLTVTFDQPFRCGRPLKAQAADGSNSGDGILFVPGLSSGQIWSKRPYGPQRPGFQAQALEVAISMPAMPHFVGGGFYTKTAIDKAMASAPGVLWGYWPAVWFYSFNPQRIRATPTPSPEVDVFELFTRVTTGPSTWTGYLHTQPYQRKVATPDASKRSISGGSWEGTPSGNSNHDIQTRNAGALVLPKPLADGKKRTVGVVWTMDKVVHYLDGVAIAESDWPTAPGLPHQLGINMACGSLSSGNVSALFFPQTDAQATGQFLTVHSIKTWEL